MKNKLFLTAACITLCLGAVTLPSGGAKAQESGSMYYYPLTEADYRDNYHAWRHFLEYQLHREQCQKYVEPPSGYVMRGCDVYRIDTMASSETTTRTEKTITELTEPSAPYYTIYFDFDKSNIRESERQNLANAAYEMQKFNLKEVTVSAHTDRAGTAEYNQKLSERRAHTVARALAEYGIKAAVIDQYAYGETDPAVKLGDGVRSQENRRVIINYKR